MASSQTRSAGLLWTKYLIVLGMFIAGAILYRSLPDQIPSHWNFAGQPDSWMPKTYGTWFLPGLALLLAILFPFVQRIDPRKESYDSFRHPWDIIQLSIVGFMAYMYGVQLNASIRPEESLLVGRYITFGIGVLFIIIGNYLGKVRSNFFVGIRTPWTLSDPEVWSKSQRFAGWVFVIAGILVIGNALFLKPFGEVFFAIIILVALMPFVHSYLIYRGKKTLFTLISLCALALAVLVIFIRLVSSEDDWTCEKGKWLPHGEPTTPQPTAPCL